MKNLFLTLNLLSISINSALHLCIDCDKIYDIIWTNLIIKHINAWSDLTYQRNLYIQFFFKSNELYFWTHIFINLKLGPNQKSKFMLRFSISKNPTISIFCNPQQLKIETLFWLALIPLLLVSTLFKLDTGLTFDCS